MPVRAKGGRLAVCPQIAPEHLKVPKSAFRWNKGQRDRAAGGMVHEYRKSAGRSPVLELAVLTAVDLHQLAQVLTTIARLEKALALGRWQPGPA